MIAADCIPAGIDHPAADFGMGLRDGMDTPRLLGPDVSTGFLAVSYGHLVGSGSI